MQFDTFLWAPILGWSYLSTYTIQSDSVLRSGENEDWYLGKDEVELVRVEQHVWKSEMWKGM